MGERSPALAVAVTIYCQRSEMENRIKEGQLDLYADRGSAAMMRANCVRSYLAFLERGDLRT